ncbi:ADP-ribosylglycohydrolase family protein [uncultured Kordia sp.]|uniref:ADP-ribosylglycohydrolase family protein n=1 Tax=uncultured Kordia sp. TaxID=507699 RepID=UPI00262462BA|nr:ADP-ribosylglycohydrolase family protein [uncultured Kordia sp.]
MNLLERLQGGIFGVATGDALGVPYEFLSKQRMERFPATDMIGHGTHNQPLGTWSDDSSLTFCLMEGLLSGYNTKVIARKFVAWFDRAYWSPHGSVFDIGITTRQAIYRLEQGHTPEICGGMDEYDNGNGSLMRILPLIYFLKGEENIEERYQIIKEVSSMTHAHFRSVLACFIYVEYGLLLLNGTEKLKAYAEVKKLINDFVKTQDFNEKELGFYHEVLKEDIFKRDPERIRGSGYVVNSLEASLWCFLTTDSYEDCVLKAVNLGEDTDTTAAIAGGLAGIYYGFDAIPETWKFQLARYEDIHNLIDRFHESLP